MKITYARPLSKKPHLSPKTLMVITRKLKDRPITSPQYNYIVNRRMPLSSIHSRYTFPTVVPRTSQPTGDAASRCTMFTYASPTQSILPRPTRVEISAEHASVLQSDLEHHQTRQQTIHDQMVASVALFSATEASSQPRNMRTRYGTSPPRLPFVLQDTLVML